MLGELIEFSGKMYHLKRTIKVSQVNGNMEALRIWRDMLGCEHVLRHGDLFLMVNHVDDIEWEEIN
tara:strand:- start:30 stop:227 length:198 start_codon:yes stop_codon:yes gene_type:complete